MPKIFRLRRGPKIRQISPLPLRFLRSPETRGGVGDKGGGRRVGIILMILLPMHNYDSNDYLPDFNTLWRQTVRQKRVETLNDTFKLYFNCTLFEWLIPQTQTKHKCYFWTIQIRIQIIRGSSADSPRNIWIDPRIRKSESRYPDMESRYSESMPKSSFPSERSGQTG